MKSLVAVLFVIVMAGVAIGDPQPAAPQSIEPMGQPRAAAEPARGMSAWQAVVLGVVEGVTEYLPVSSTGHLILAQRAMGIGAVSGSQKEAADAYAVVIQGGAILAVVLLYFGRVKGMLRGIIGRDAAGKKMAINIVAAFIPAAVIGLAVSKYKEQLFDLRLVAAAWFIGGVAILAVAFRRGGRKPREAMTLEAMTWKMATAIGVAQCIAMSGGTSRSLVTIVGGILAGLSLAAAVEFSFLLGLATLSAATLHDAQKHGALMLEHYGPLSLAAGFIAAFISAVLAIEWMVAYLNKHGMAAFGYYRVALGIVVAVLLWMGVMAC